MRVWIITANFGHSYYFFHTEAKTKKTQQLDSTAESSFLMA